MVSRRVFVVAAAGSVLAAGAGIAAPAITSIEGSVGRKNFKRFSSVIGDHMDKIVHLHVGVEVDPAKKKKFYSDLEGKQLTMYLPYDPEAIGNAEILINGGVRYEHGQYVVDGYYIVKSGGMHQGTLSWGLVPVDEAQVLLSGATRKKPIVFK